MGRIALQGEKVIAAIFRRLSESGQRSLLDYARFLEHQLQMGTSPAEEGLQRDVTDQVVEGLKAIRRAKETGDWSRFKPAEELIDELRG